MKWTFIALCLVWNLLVFVFYGWDKRKAIRHQYRISEKTLLLSSLAAAGLGAGLAGQVFHHKTRKWYFWLTWLLGTIIEILFIYYIWRS